MTSCGVPFMKRLTGSVGDDLLDLVAQVAHRVLPLGLDSQLVDGAVGERRRERVVDEPVLLDEREAVEAVAFDRHLEVVAAARAVGDRELGRVGERVRAAAASNVVVATIGIIVAMAGSVAPFSRRCPNGCCERSSPRSAAPCTRRRRCSCRASCAAAPACTRRRRRTCCAIAIELVGGVETAPSGEPASPSRRSWRSGRWRATSSSSGRSPPSASRRSGCSQPPPTSSTARARTSTR